MKAEKDQYGETNKKMVLQLFVSGMSARSMEAIENIKQLCNDELKNNYELDIIDLYKNPAAASAQQIVFSPSLVKLFPLPKKILIGTFADREKVKKALGITTRE